MSDAVKKLWTDGFLAKRKLKSLVKDEGKKQPDTDPANAHAKYTVLTMNLAPYFNGIGLANIQLPDPMTVSVDVEVSGEGASNLQTDATLLQLVQRLAQNQIEGFKAEFAKLLKEADPAATNDEKKKFVEKQLKGQIAVLETKISANLVKAITSDKAYLERDKKRRKKWQIKTGVSIGMNTIVVIGSAAATGLSWGATSPAAVVAIARSCVSIAHSVADLAMTLDQTGALIKGQLLVLKKLMDEGDDSDKKTKAANSAKEVALGSVSGILGAKSVPTIKNCKGYIETYGMKITGLEIEREKTGPEVYQYMDVLAKLNEEVKSLPAGSKQRKTAEDFIAASEKHFQDFLEHVEHTVAGILKGYKNREEWEAALEDLPVHGWTEHTAAVVGGATDLALGLGSSGSALEAGLSAITSLASAANDQLLDRI